MGKFLQIWSKLLLDFSLQYNNVKDTVLAAVKSGTNKNGDFINPRFCVSRRPSIVNFNEEYTEMYNTSKGHSTYNQLYRIT